MTLKEAIEVLRMHNRWRRGDDSVPETNPKLLGEAIDTVIKEFDEVYFTTDVFRKYKRKYDPDLDQYLFSNISNNSDDEYDTDKKI